MKIYLSVLAFVCIFFSCSKKDNNDTPPGEQPTAKAQFDNSNFGIYKGVFVGSSGIAIVNINNDNSISAILKIDGQTYNFTTSQTVQQGQNTNLNFSSGANTFTFSVNANGSGPVISNIVINGHPNAAIILVKETSSVLVKCFEGTYQGSESGIFNAVIYGNVITGLVRSSSNVLYTATGSVANGQISATAGNVSGGATFTGTISGNNTSGTWINTGAGWSGTWSGTRTY